jgi:hypothetical protein
MKRILEVQKEIGNLSKSSKNPFFKSAYLDLNDLLNAVHPLLHEKNLMLIQPIVDNKVVSAIVDEGGETLISSELPLPDIKDPQKLGSCITYYRRYTLKSLLAIAEKDDDGQAASKPEPKELPILVFDSKNWKKAVENKMSVKNLALHVSIPMDLLEKYEEAIK